MQLEDYFFVPSQEHQNCLDKSLNGWKMYKIKFMEWSWPGQFARIAGNTGNHGYNRKFHKSDQTLNQTKRDINKLMSLLKN